MHWFREGNRQRSRILYVFRTPGGVRVGRAALEPEVLRQIESQHPEIAFDWSVVRDNQQVIETSVEPRRRRPKRDEAPAAPPEPVAAPVVAAAAPAQPERPPAIPSTIQGSTPDEQIAFLNQWYPVLRERIPRRTTDPAMPSTSSRRNRTARRRCGPRHRSGACRSIGCSEGRPLSAESWIRSGADRRRTPTDRRIRYAGAAATLE